MFEIKIKIENDLKWIGAIEKLAGCRNSVNEMESCHVEFTELKNAGEPWPEEKPLLPGFVKLENAPDTEKGAQTELDREAVKKELTALGIQFNERLRTPTLLEMLEKAKATGELQPVSDTGLCTTPSSDTTHVPEQKTTTAPPETESTSEPDSPWEMTEAPPVVVDEKKYTLEDLRSALGKFAVKHGKEKAFQVLKETTGAVKLSEIPVEKYTALMGVIDG